MQLRTSVSNNLGNLQFCLREKVAFPKSVFKKKVLTCKNGSLP